MYAVFGDITFSQWNHCFLFQIYFIPNFNFYQTLKNKIPFVYTNIVISTNKRKIRITSIFYLQLMISYVIHLYFIERGVQHYVIKFVNDLRQVGGFLKVFRFLPPYNWNIVESGRSKITHCKSSLVNKVVLHVVLFFLASALI
jgi:hypothetical protein